MFKSEVKKYVDSKIHINIIKTIIFSLLMCPCFAFSTYGKSAIQKELHSLPWEIISNKFHDGSKFCSRTRPTPYGKQKQKKEDGHFDSVIDYAFKSGESLVFDLSLENISQEHIQKINVDLAIWKENLWQSLGKRVARIESNIIRLKPEISSEGFFKLTFTSENNNRQLPVFEIYAIICDNWKKSILSFCQKQKEKIETNADLQLMYSSISASHFDHTMETINKSSVLSRRILEILREAIKSKQDFDAGQICEILS